MDLALNTRHLIGPTRATKSVESVAIEYHLLSRRELYDKSIITPDRYSSDAARWVIRGGKKFYSVTVVSRPYYNLPQELCLSFDCFQQELKTKVGDIQGTEFFLPLEQVAFEFSVLLSVFAREPLILIGLRREGDMPVVDRPHKIYPSKTQELSTPIPFGINSPEFCGIVSGLAHASDELIQAIIGAAKFYHAGLSLISFDPTIAYVSFVSAIECLSGYQYRDRVFDFNGITKFNKARDILVRLNRIEEAKADVSQLKQELVRIEYFVRQKFVLFLSENITDEFWEIPDELHPYKFDYFKITQDKFEQYLRDIYDRRSKYIHGGLPFPNYVELGLREMVPAPIFTQLLQLQQKKRFIPPLTWFERLCHSTIIQYMRQTLTPDFVFEESSRLEEKSRFLNLISELPENVQESLKKLVYWTARFLGAALINPHAPNIEWADSSETIATLKQKGIISGEGVDLQGSSWLKDREMGEIVGEFVFGVAQNPFRGNEILLPKNWGFLKKSEVRE
jgi:hypothetical protein